VYLTGICVVVIAHCTYHCMLLWRTNALSPET